MPRRQFFADLQTAQQNALPENVRHIKPGDEDGQIEFHFTNNDDETTDSVKLIALVSDLGDYPKSHDYFVFANEDAPPRISEAIQRMRSTTGKNITETLHIVSRALSTQGVDSHKETGSPGSCSSVDDFSDEDGEDHDMYGSDDDPFAYESIQRYPSTSTSGKQSYRSIDKSFRARIIADLVAAKKMGFKVGVLGHILDGYDAFVTISVRMCKLGISEEAMQAWQVKPSEYLILIIRYPDGYETLEGLEARSSNAEQGVEMRICSGHRYKPTLPEAVAAFSSLHNHDDSPHGPMSCSTRDSKHSSIKETFISRPLVGLLHERLIPILKMRKAAGVGWAVAEELFLRSLTEGIDRSLLLSNASIQRKNNDDDLPAAAKTDAYKSDAPAGLSYPLLAMQFLLRHFIWCTRFCLVCHRGMNADFEAIKPYVCDSELCLYQYMTLGFGPRIEHEILTQPNVVDLLVSFCYTSARYQRLNEFPDGLALMVPSGDTQLMGTNPATSRSGDSFQQQSAPLAGSQNTKEYDIRFDRGRLELVFSENLDWCPVRRGDWVVIQANDRPWGNELHCCVNDPLAFPRISFFEPVELGSLNPAGTRKLSTGEGGGLNTPASTSSTEMQWNWRKAKLVRYNQDFKLLEKTAKCSAICRLLDTLPTVKEMQSYLSQGGNIDLRAWLTRLSPAALGLLRWIIASNRACILQTDCADKAASTRNHERLYGMGGFLQFRFAMGAPDKEQRFISAVRQTTQRLKLNYPTMFAWHGSPLHNWHAIIREGLNYNRVDHGRAFGNGVYHSLEATTSSAYSTPYTYGFNGRSGWRSSALQVCSAIALNEIVNAPGEFQCQSPHLVCQHLDWIQTRYLFVSCVSETNAARTLAEWKPTNAFAQDPMRIPRGMTGPIIIPASAIRSMRSEKRTRLSSSPQNGSPWKKLKGEAGGPMASSTSLDDDGNSSDATDDEDRVVLIGLGAQDASENLRPIDQMAKPKGLETDFIPGTLDFGKLPLMPVPEYATSGTTRRLLNELQSLAKIQTTTPAVELGWYIDVEKIDNAYQWIVELHSFHTFELGGKPLPLVDDMKRKGVRSIVLEVRFNKDFPYSPPYVRVIRPRFLNLAQGGGGHIVLGGAMCMELLTNSGWSSVSTMESVLMQVRMAITSDPPAKLDMRGAGDYGTGEAASGYIRACQTHGWMIPDGFREMVYGLSPFGHAS